MHRIWFDDLEKAVNAVRSKTTYKRFNSISNNAFGDFVFKVNYEIAYIVKHDDFTVWCNFGDCYNPIWREIEGNLC